MLQLIFVYGFTKASQSKKAKNCLV